MSEILRLASALRRSSDDDLKAVISQRMVNSSGLRDFFDLAESLSQPKSVTGAVAGLPKPQVDALVAILEDRTPEPKAAQALVRLMLIDCDTTGKYSLFESTAQCLRQLAPSKSEHTELSVPNQETVDRDSGLAAFETIQALTELIFDVEQRYIREVGKKNVGLPDIKRLAQHIRQTNEFAREIYELANHADLIGLSSGRWQLGPQASAWLEWHPTERNRHLLRVWRDLLGSGSADDLLDALKTSGDAHVHSLTQQLRENYPFADGVVNSRIARVVAFAERIGLSHNGWLSTWAIQTLKANFDDAANTASAVLPTPQRKLISQADLSLIAPGPLPTDLEIMIRRFADTEQIGMASTYRMSALSISHGLETGLTEDQIRGWLLELTEKPLPQPVDYLIREASQRFGRLTVGPGELETKSVVKSLDSILLAQILNESKLKPFAMYAMPDGSIGCRFETEMLYFGLREAGFSAVRIDQNGKVISPRAPLATDEYLEVSSTLDVDIDRLREQDKRLGSEPDGDDIARSIQLAIKNKSVIVIGVSSNSGSELEFTLEPIGFANGRLRAKDKKADIERTLPLASITRVSLG
ncbi:MAG: helicase-associated domain-containing protein [Rhodoluna sp.]